jgi:hypothetical protein
MPIHVPENFYRQTITRAITLVGATNIYVSAHPTPSEGFITISPASTTLREIVYYTAKGTDSNGTYITVTLANRGLGGTTAQTHVIGEPIRMNVSAETIEEVSDAIDQIVAGGAQDASTSTKGIVKLNTAPASPTNPIAMGSNAITIETTTGTTHSLTTVAGEIVIVWAKGELHAVAAGAGSRTIYLNYNGVQKDVVVAYNENTTTYRPFSLMYTETPGAATQNITVTSSADVIANVVIIVMKIKT